jgi:site-specific DNA-methyltransferase (adenine-specific)
MEIKEILDKIICGDCLEIMKSIPDNTIDAVITDPPYGLSDHDKDLVSEVLTKWLGGDDAYMPKTKGFMEKEWDAFVPPPRVWKEVIRVMKPGAHMLCFAGARTQDLMSISLRLAGFEIRDTIMWIYGSGFPKGLNISKAIDKMQGAETQTPEAKQWDGWNTQLKPAYEPIILARKPISEDNVPANVLKWGTGAINVNACKIGNERVVAHHAPPGTFAGGQPNRGSDKNYYTNIGRYPSNVIIECTCDNNQQHTDPDCPCYLLDKQHDGVSRFFYHPKASPEERKIMEHFNFHPTVKPLQLVIYLTKLIAPPNAIILDPFVGSGTTAVACKKLNRHYIGIDANPDFCEMAFKRLAEVSKSLDCYCQEDENGKF